MSMLEQWVEMFGIKTCGTYPARNHETILNSFITPNEPVVKETSEYIVNTLVRDSVEDRIVAAFNFVAINVIYTADRAQFGKGDFWQYPKETLGQVFTDSNIIRMYGDCEDSSFLLVSLLLALDIPSQSVRVGISEVHAWVEVKLGNTWYLFETTDDKELSELVPARSIIGKSSAYAVKVYVYHGGCSYGR